MFLRNSTKKTLKNKENINIDSNKNEEYQNASSKSQDFAQRANQKKPQFEHIISEIEEFKANPEITHLVEDDESATIIVNCDQNIYADYSGKNMLNWDLFEFIEDTYKMINRKAKPIKIKLVFPAATSSKEKEKIASLIKIHYGIEYKETRKDIKKENLKGLLSLLAGIIVLAFSFITRSFIPAMDNEIINTVFEIFSTVLMWEAVGMFVFTNGSNRAYLIKCLHLFEAKIEY